MIGLRKLVSEENGSPFQETINSGIVPKLIEFMKNDHEPHLQLEAAWILTNIASGTTKQTQTIIDKGSMPYFVRLLKSKKVDVTEQTIWALGNISGDSSEFRDIVLRWGGLVPLLKIVDTSDKSYTIKHGTWAISNLTRGRPEPDLCLVRDAIPVLCRIIMKEHDADVLTDATWSLSYLSRMDDAVIGTIVETGIIPSLIKHLDNPFLSVLIPSIRTIGNICSGNEAETNAVLFNSDFLPNLLQLMNHEKKAVKREACWTLSNITAGNSLQITAVVKYPGMIEKLVELCSSDVVEVSREAAWVLSNATNHSTLELKSFLHEKRTLECFVYLLESPDMRIKRVVLEGILNFLTAGDKEILEKGKTTNEYKEYLVNNGAGETIVELMKSKDEDVSSKATEIVEIYEFESGIDGDSFD